MTHLFLDNDGVLAGFDEHVRDLFGSLPQEIGDESLWSLVGTNPQFWLDMRKMPDADVLWRVVAPYRPTILTGCPSNGYEKAVLDKPLWIERHFGPVPVITCVSRDKPKHMKAPGDILIDDYIVNCRRWEEAGGRAIVHRTAARSIEQLLAIWPDPNKPALS